MDLLTLLMMAALFGALYFMMIRPAQKRAKDQQQLISTIQPGSRIMTSSGIYGTVRHVGATQTIIEISPGVEMTLTKQAIMKVVRAEDEEFEYDDDDADVLEAEIADAPATLDELELETDADIAAEDAPASTDEKR